MDNQNNRNNKNNPKNNRQMGRHSCDDTADGVSRYGTVFADAGERPAGDQLR